MTDKKTIIIVVATLGATIVLSVISATLLTFVNKPVPDLVSDLAKVGLGAISALLARTSAEPDRDIEVKSVSPTGASVIKKGE